MDYSEIESNWPDITPEILNKFDQNDPYIKGIKELFIDNTEETRDYKHIFSLMTESDMKGNTYATLCLAWMCGRGYGVSQNLELEKIYLEKVIDNGNPWGVNYILCDDSSDDELIKYLKLLYTYSGHEHYIRHYCVCKIIHIQNKKRRYKILNKVFKSIPKYVLYNNECGIVLKFIKYFEKKNRRKKKIHKLKTMFYLTNYFNHDLIKYIIRFY